MRVGSLAHNKLLFYIYIFLSLTVCFTFNAVELQWKENVSPLWPVWIWDSERNSIFSPAITRLSVTYIGMVVLLMTFCWRGVETVWH